MSQNGDPIRAISIGIYSIGGRRGVLGWHVFVHVQKHMYTYSHIYIYMCEYVFTYCVYTVCMVVQIYTCICGCIIVCVTGALKGVLPMPLTHDTYLTGRCPSNLFSVARIGLLALSPGKGRVKPEYQRLELVLVEPRHVNPQVWGCVS